MKTSRPSFLLSAAAWSPAAAAFVLCLSGGVAQAQIASTCATNADCGPDETCQVTAVSGGGGTAPGCTPDQCGPNPGFVAPVMTMEYRSCVPTPRACTMTSQCPFPLVCAEDPNTGGTISTDPALPPTTTSPPTAGAPAPALVAQPLPPPPSTTVCTWKPTLCTTAADCGDARFDCIPFASTTVCTGTVAPDPGTGSGSTGTGTATPVTTGGASGGTTGSGGTSGSADRAAPIAVPPTDPTLPPGTDPGVPLPPDQTCVVDQVIKGCFPRPVPCATDAQCEAGWTCHDMTAYTDAPFYQAGASNHFCVPQGIALALDGKARVDDSGFSILGGGVVESSFVGGTTKGTGTDSATPPQTPGGNGNTMLAHGGCTFAGRDGAIGGAWLLLLAGLVRFARRRRA